MNNKYLRLRISIVLAAVIIFVFFIMGRKIGHAIKYFTVPDCVSPSQTIAAYDACMRNAGKFNCRMTPKHFREYYDAAAYLELHCTTDDRK